MSNSSNTRESSRWFRTAQADLAAARDLNASGHFAQACFLCQQAAEKAVKAALFSLDADPRGHSVTRLLAAARESMPVTGDEITSLVEDAEVLDRFYVPTRYPNGLPELIPSEMYKQKDAERALAAATRILDAVANHLNTDH